MFSVCSTDKSFEIIHLSDEIDLDFTRFTFLLKIKCIKHFLKMNINMSLNVFVYNEDTKEIIGPLFQSKVEKPLYINMLLFEDCGNGSPL